jgi:Ca2+-binding EF-hand superfamily protein
MKKKFNFPNGTASRFEYKQFFRNTLPDANSNDEKGVEFLFKVFDIDSNNELTFVEFMMAAFFDINMLSEEEKRAHYEKVFHVLDKDNNLTISKKELRKYYKIESQGMEDTRELRQKVADVFDRYDTSKTGQMSMNDFINFAIHEQIFDFY